MSWAPCSRSILSPSARRRGLLQAGFTRHVVVREHREYEGLRFQVRGEVAQREAQLRQPILVDVDLAVLRFEGGDQLLRFGIELSVQQIRDRRREMPVVGRWR